jgi:photosystem II stability/assembly factor-like uncharacterized protein
MKEKIVVVGFVILLVASFAVSTVASSNKINFGFQNFQANWFLQTSWDTSGIFSLYFSNSNVGWACGVGTLLHTSDGGNIWYEQDYAPASNLYSVFFVNNYEGWASGSHGVILHTTDGGNTWIEQNHNFMSGGYMFDCLYFLNSNVGWAVGGKGATFNSPAKRVILKTTDGGNNWITNLYESYSTRLVGVHFTDSNNGWAVADGLTILHTSDGGNNWIEQNNPATYQLTDVYFTNSNNGWVTGIFGNLLHTTNGGDTWTSVNPGTTGSFSAVHFIDSQNGWICGGNNNEAIILRTNNGGNSWIADSPGTNNVLYDIFLTDSTHGWAGGIHGDIVSTIQTSNSPPNQPFDPIPTNGETNVNLDPTLSVKVIDPNSDTMTVSFYNSSDNSLIGTDNNVASGETAYIIWNGLQSSTTYNWYAIADDGEDYTQSSTWSFTTAGPNHPPEQPINPMPSEGAIEVELNPTLSVSVTDPNLDTLIVRFYDASDDSLIGTDYGVISGGMAFVTWSDLSGETSYSWYAVADDGEYTIESNTWSFNTCCGNMPPYQPINPIPSNSASGIGLNPTLSVEINDPDSDTMTVSFYDASDDSLIGIDENVISGNRANVIWYDLSPSITYNWYAITDDGEYTNQSDTWSFITDAENNAPLEPSAPIPQDELNSASLNPTLSVEVNDPDADLITVRFYDASDDSLIGIDDDVISGNRAYTSWNDLSPSTTYNWYAIAYDEEYSTQSNTWSFETSAGNNAPSEPVNPIPINDLTGIDFNATLSVEINDPDTDSITVRFYDANDDSLIGTDFSVPSGSRAYIGWFNLNPLSVYKWYAVAYDGEYSTKSDTWSFITKTNIENNPPNIPEILGQTSGKPGIEYNYTFSSIDPDGDDVVYCIQWGDETGEVCIGPYPSGEIVTVSHIYEERGSYTISAKVEDTNEAESEMGYLKVIMPKNKIINNRLIVLLLESIEKFLNRLEIIFPIIDIVIL